MGEINHTLGPQGVEKTDQIWCFSDAAGQKKVKTLFLSEIFDFLIAGQSFWLRQGKIDQYSLL